MEWKIDFTARTITTNCSGYRQVEDFKKVADALGGSWAFIRPDGDEVVILFVWKDEDIQQAVSNLDRIVLDMPSTKRPEPNMKSLADREFLTLNEQFELDHINSLKAKKVYMTQELFDRRKYLLKVDFTGCRQDCNMEEFKKGGECDKNGCFFGPHEIIPDK